jgi:hypothetical protein
VNAPGKLAATQPDCHDQVLAKLSENPNPGKVETVPTLAKFWTHN